MLEGRLPAQGLVLVPCIALTWVRITVSLQPLLLVPVTVMNARLLFKHRQSQSLPRSGPSTMECSNLGEYNSVTAVIAVPSSNSGECKAPVLSTGSPNPCQ
ncbi:hypothetical protein J6590_092220, partial [Homalodisca vitripennis]